MRLRMPDGSRGSASKMRPQERKSKGAAMRVRSSPIPSVTWTRTLYRIAI